MNVETPILNTTFKQESNTTFNNGLFSPEKISHMHETTERLYIAAMELAETEGQTAVAKLLNASPQTLNNWEARGMSKQGMMDAEQAIGVSAAWLRTGSGEMRADRRLITHHTGSGKTATSLIAPDLKKRPLIDPTTDPDYLHVPRVKFKLSAGVSGFAIDVEEGNGKPIFFRKDFFENNGYRPERLFAVRISGQSMEPRLWEDDLVVINTDDTVPKDGEPFALNYEGELVIKRLRRDAGEWWATSDNPDQQRYAPKRCTEDVKIIGMVVYRQGSRI